MGTLVLKCNWVLQLLKKQNHGVADPWDGFTWENFAYRIITRSAYPPKSATADE